LTIQILKHRHQMTHQLLWLSLLDNLQMHPSYHQVILQEFQLYLHYHQVLRKRYHHHRNHRYLVLLLHMLHMLQLKRLDMLLDNLLCHQGWLHKMGGKKKTRSILHKGQNMGLLQLWLCRSWRGRTIFKQLWLEIVVDVVKHLCCNGQPYCITAFDV
jgi:hypothetical protein